MYCAHEASLTFASVLWWPHSTSLPLVVHAACCFAGVASRAVCLFVSLQVSTGDGPNRTVAKINAARILAQLTLVETDARVTSDAALRLRILQSGCMLSLLEVANAVRVVPRIAGPQPVSSAFLLTLHL